MQEPRDPLQTKAFSSAFLDYDPSLPLTAATIQAPCCLCLLVAEPFFRAVLRIARVIPAQTVELVLPCPDLQRMSGPHLVCVYVRSAVDVEPVWIWHNAVSAVPYHVMASYPCSIDTRTCLIPMWLPISLRCVLLAQVMLIVPHALEIMISLAALWSEALRPVNTCCIRSETAGRDPS